MLIRAGEESVLSSLSINDSQVVKENAQNGVNSQRRNRILSQDVSLN